MNKNPYNKKKRSTTYHVVPKGNDPVPDSLESWDAPDAKYGKVYMFGENSSSSKTTGQLQNYSELRQQHAQNKTLFSDENFSAKTIALTKLKGEVAWKRPFEITDNPQFIVHRATRFDIDQGLLGDCWFLAAIANVTLNEKLLSMVVPSDQSFEENYAGIFHFRFWQYGKWVDVVVDDLLPTINNKLIYLQSDDPNEFWPSLLEKAYAKFYGSYKNIEGGQITEALEDLCGGLSEFYEANAPEIYEIMEMSHKRSSFLGCSIVSSETEGKRRDGLITRHAYSVTDIKRINNVNNSETKLIRLRNPWGNDVEWNGAWSDNSEDWDLLPKNVRDEFRAVKADGEFWMAAEDFQKCFTYVDICHLNPTSFSNSQDGKMNWNFNMFEGTWVPNVTAGGGFEDTETFSHNPQFHLTVRGNKSSPPTSVIIGLMQKDRRASGENELPLEINIFRVNSPTGQLLDQAFFQTNDPVIRRAGSGIRQLTIRVLLPVGKYCIIPSTRTPDVYASYLLRIYSEINANVMNENGDP